MTIVWDVRKPLLRSEIVMSDSNPGHIAQTIAPVEPPETAVLVESKKSRIKKDVNNILRKNTWKLLFLT